MNDSQAVPTRRLWLTIAFALGTAPFIYAYVIATLLAGGSAAVFPDVQVPRLVFWAAAGAAVMASLAWTHLRLRVPIETAAGQPAGQLLTAMDFQQRSIVSLALAELACIIGFVQVMTYRTPLRDFLPFGAATILVIVLDTLPVGLRYWSAWDKRAAGR